MRATVDEFGELVTDDGAAREATDRYVQLAARLASTPAGTEDISRTDATHRIVLALAAAGAPLEVTLQANLRRTPEDWPAFARAGIPIRLVKGAYVEPPAVAHGYGEATDLAFLGLAGDLAAARARFSPATHDPVLREAVLAAGGAHEVEMLLGVRPADARALTARGIAVRLYVPFGDAWFRYWMRRVAESRGVR